MLPLPGCQIRLEQVVRHSNDAVHGRTQLVTHIGEEVTLRLSGSFGLLAGHLHVAHHIERHSLKVLEFLVVLAKRRIRVFELVMRAHHLAVLGIESLVEPFRLVREVWSRVPRELLYRLDSLSAASLSPGL